VAKRRSSCIAPPAPARQLGHLNISALANSHAVARCTIPHHGTGTGKPQPCVGGGRERSSRLLEALEGGVDRIDKADDARPLDSRVIDFEYLCIQVANFGFAVRRSQL
jgi:hypothetical protein